MQSNLGRRCGAEKFTATLKYKCVFGYTVLVLKCYLEITYEQLTRKKNKCRIQLNDVLNSLYLSDHWHVNEEADDAADGSNYLSPERAKGRFRGQHVHDSRYQTLYPYKLKTKEREQRGESEWRSNRAQKERKSSLLTLWVRHIYQFFTC